VYDRAFNDTPDWNEKENKMFNQYIAMFTSDIREIFGVAAQSSDSDEIKRKKEHDFDSIVNKLRNIMQKRHYVSTVYPKLCLQCFDAVGWAAGRASSL